MLGIFDTLFLTTQFIQVGLRNVECDVGFHLNPECKGKDNFQWFIRKGVRVLNFLSPFAYTCSIYLIILVTIERYIVICHRWVSSKPFLASSSNIWPCLGLGLAWLFWFFFLWLKPIYSRSLERKKIPSILSFTDIIVLY